MSLVTSSVVLVHVGVRLAPYCRPQTSSPVIQLVSSFPLKCMPFAKQRTYICNSFDTVQEVWSSVCGQDWSSAPPKNEWPQIWHSPRKSWGVASGCPLQQCRVIWGWSFGAGNWEDAIFRKNRESRLIRTLGSSWPRGINLRTDGLWPVHWSSLLSQVKI